MSKVKWMLAGAVLWLAGGVAKAEDDNTFRNATAGISLQKPETWVYATAAQNAENLARVKLSDAEFQSAMQKYATTPMVAMMKYPEPFEDVNPSFKLNLKPYGALKGKSAIELAQIVLGPLQSVFKDFAIAQAPVGVQVAGIESAYARVNYTLQVSDLQDFPITSEFWIVPRGDYFFLIGAGTRQDESTGTREEIAQILSSIRIEN